MAGEPVPPDWPPLTTADVRRLLARLPELAEAGAAQVRWQSPRPFSAAALVSAGPWRLLVKRHGASLRSLASLEAEHAFMRHLSARGVPVPAVLEDGRASAWQDGGYVYEVLRALPGLDLYADAPSWTPFISPQHATAAGATLAKLHLASQSYQASERPVEPLYASARVISSPDPWTEVQALAQQLPGLARYLSGRPWREQLAAALAPFHDGFLPYARCLGELWAHNDWHPSNLLWSAEGQGAEVAGVIDFGLANRTSAGYDLATALERSAVGWLEPPARRPVHRAAVRELLQGYWSARPLSAGEATALPHLLPLVHVDYALSEIDYFWRVVRSPANADLAYEAYLLGHLHWFAGDEGRRLCSYVAQVLEELGSGKTT